MWTIKIKGIYGEIIKEDGEGEAYTEQTSKETITDERYNIRDDTSTNE